MPLSARPGTIVLLIGLSAAAVYAAAAGPPLPVPAADPLMDPRQDPSGASSSHLPRFEISVSYVANLVHWIDNLSGTSRGKTVRVYRQFWERRFGFPSPEEMSLLQEWARIREKELPRREPRILNASGCLPQTEERPSWRQVFLIRSYEAGSVEAFVAAMSPDLNDEDRATLRRVLDAFGPRFDRVWRETEFLSLFEKRFRSFLDEGGLRRFLGRMASFFGVDPDRHPPGRIHLMALPAESATHAQADGAHLQMEIRPNDTPVEQIQVIAHETAHYLWHLTGPARNDAFAKQVFEATPEGPVVWSLLREGLPTALGQGLAEATLAPQRFGEQQRWYHTDDVDRFAKEIFPAVAEAFRAGRSVDDGVLAEIARSVERSEIVRAARPSDYLAQSFFGIGEGMFVPYRQIRERGRILDSWPSGISDADGAAFAERYACLGGVVLLGPANAADASSLPAIFAPPGSDGLRAASGAPAAAAAGAPPGSQRSTTRPGPAWPGPTVSSIVAARRPGGGTIFFLTAARTSDIERIGNAFLDLTSVPESPVILAEEPAR